MVYQELGLFKVGPPCQYRSSQSPSEFSEFAYYCAQLTRICAEGHGYPLTLDVSKISEDTLYYQVHLRVEHTTVIMLFLLFSVLFLFYLSVTTTRTTVE